MHLRTKSLLFVLLEGGKVSSQRESPFYLINCSAHQGFVFFFLKTLGKPVMIITEYMENGSLDAFLRVCDYLDRKSVV